MRTEEVIKRSGVCVCDDDDDDDGEKTQLPEGGRTEFLYVSPGLYVSTGPLEKATKARCVRGKWNPKDFHIFSAYVHRMRKENNKKAMPCLFSHSACIFQGPYGCFKAVDCEEGFAHASFAVGR